jgi:outer membrane biosynthesis protein TonB
MTTGKRSILLRVTLLAVVANGYNLVAQQNEPVYDGDVNVKSFEEMPYPPIPRQTRIEGTVVVSAKPDANGRVTSTSDHLRR